MPTPPQTPPSLHPPDRRRAYRPIIAGATLLLTAGLLAGCLFPGMSARQNPVLPPAEAVEPPPTPEPEPTSPDPEPAQPETPPPDASPAEPKPDESTPAPPLPEVPEGEPSQFVVHGDRSCKAVALTYDAGSGADGAVAILDMLKKYDLKVTFFLTGKWAEKFPDLAKRIADEGHEIGNHSYSHPDLTKIPDDEVIKQLKDAEEAIRQATGRESRPLFREPYGAFNEHERRLVRQAGYSYSIYWDVDTLDWQFPSVETLVSRIMKAQGGSIVLMHMNVADTAVASDEAIPQLQAKGYEIVTVSQLLQCKSSD